MKNKDLVGGMGCLVAAVAMALHAMRVDYAPTTIIACVLAVIWLLAGLGLLIEHAEGIIKGRK